MRTTNDSSVTLEQQRLKFCQRKLFATPLSGTLVWLIVGISGFLFSDEVTSLVLFIATGCIVYISMIVSKLTGEDILANAKENNAFDKLFFLTVGQSLLTYAIAIPFFNLDQTSLPLTVGILTGTMWLPLSWIINHWVGLFHAISRTLLVTILWYMLPEHRFTAIPFGIVIIYLITLVILQKRRRPEEILLEFNQRPT